MILSVFNIIPFTAGAAEADIAGTAAASGTTGDCTWTLDDDGVLTISGNGKMGDYVYNSAPWGRSVTQVVIQSGVTSIGCSAFEYCSGLKRIEIPDSVTSIGERAFENCTSLTSIDIPDFVTSIGAYAFRDCTSLTSVTIGNSVKSIGDEAFEFCTGLASIDIPDFITRIGENAFYNTAWYNNQPDGIVYAGKVVYRMKGYCPSEVIIKAGTLGIADYAFEYCTELTSIIIPDSVTSIGKWAFSGCTGLTSIIIPDSVTSIGYEALGYIHYKYDPSDRITTIMIYGYKGSAAEEYANRNEIVFIRAKGKCDNCNSTLYEDDYHEGYPATCVKDGLTDGYICPSCEHKSQTVIPALGHKPIIDKAVPATCQHEGHTTGSYCENCGEVYVQSQVIPKLPHTPVKDEAIAADCTHTGLTEGSHCSECNEILVAQKVTVALGHSYEMVPIKPATFFHTGLTEGVRCSRCGDWLIEQEEIPKLTGEGIFGDIDRDEAVDVRDATWIQRLIAGIEIPFTVDDVYADVDGDGDVTVMDATAIQYYLIMLKNPYNIGEPIA